MVDVLVENDPWCAVAIPASRRFYVHERSFAHVLAAQPSLTEELLHGLALSGASRAADQAAQDWSLLGGGSAVAGEASVSEIAAALHEAAADMLRSAFQCLVHLVPPRFGATRLLLGGQEAVTAWCYEDGYFTYATDEDAAAVMYAESGSLKALRSAIRREPGADPSLTMISGQGLFLFDQAVGVGPATARSYRSQAARLERNGRVVDVAHVDSVRKRVDDLLGELVPATARTLDDRELRAQCAARADATVAAVLRSLTTVG